MAKVGGCPGRAAPIRCATPRETRSRRLRRDRWGPRRRAPPYARPVAPSSRRWIEGGTDDASEILGRDAVVEVFRRPAARLGRARNRRIDDDLCNRATRRPKETDQRPAHRHDPIWQRQRRKHGTSYFGGFLGPAVRPACRTRFSGRGLGRPFGPAFRHAFPRGRFSGWRRGRGVAEDGRRSSLAHDRGWAGAVSSKSFRSGNRTPPEPDWSTGSIEGGRRRWAASTRQGRKRSGGAACEKGTRRATTRGHGTR